MNYRRATNLRYIWVTNVIWEELHEFQHPDYQIPNIVLRGNLVYPMGNLGCYMVDNVPFVLRNIFHHC